MILVLALFIYDLGFINYLYVVSMYEVAHIDIDASPENPQGLHLQIPWPIPENDPIATFNGVCCHIGCNP